MSQCHQFGTNPNPVRDFLLVTNTNLQPILHHLKIIADQAYWSHFRFR